MSEKITKASADSIAAEVVKIKHQPLVDAANKAWLEASIKAYDFVFAEKETAIAESLSNRWVNRYNYFYIRTDVNGNVQAKLEVSRVVPDGYTSSWGSNCKIYSSSDEPIRNLIDAKTAFDEATKNMANASKKLSAIIRGRSPVALVKDWPEIKPYLDKRSISLPNTSLVVSVAKLNEEYGLPDPDEVVEVA